MDDIYKKKKRKDETAVVVDVENGENKIKRKKKKSDAPEVVFGQAEALAQDLPRVHSMSRNGRGREDLLRSIAAFLEGSGFSKTLSVFLSEAKIEVNDRGGSCVNLEELFDKFIETSKKDPIASIEWSKEQDAVDDLNAKIKEKKRKCKLVSDSIKEESTGKNCLDASIGATGNTYYEEPLNEEKKKRRTMKLGEDKGREGSLNFEEVVKEKIEELKDLTSNHSFEIVDIEKNKGEKNKKKKRTKTANQSLEQFEVGVNQDEVIAAKPIDGGDYASTKHHESMNTEDLVINLQENVEVGTKKKKKNKNTKPEKLTSDSLPTINSEEYVENSSHRLGKHANGILQKSGFRKESIEISEKNSSDVEKTTTKKRKRSSSTETPVQAENIPVPLNGEFKESSVAISNVVLDKHEEDPSSLDTQQQVNEHQHANGNVEKNQTDGSTRTKSMKKEKRSTELKAVNVFQRIKVDDVRFADERLQDNSYWALDDSGSGYGAKAQEVLGQVRGRDFRHEKTKKKRGTYRGGQIDLQTHSVKFSYSDDDAE